MVVKEVKRVKVPAIIILILCMVCVVCFTGCGSKSVLELNLAHFWPAGHPVETDLVKPWIAAVAEATEGRVKVTSFPTESLLKSDAIYEGIKKGVADLGLSCFAYTRGQFPVLEVFELPGIVYNNSAAATRIAWEGTKLLNPKEVQDTTLLMVFTTGPGHLFSKKPVKDINDLKGLEIRATGLSAATLKTLGAVPVAMPQAEAWEALSKGIVKANLGPTEILKGWRQAEVTNYITITPFLYNTLFFFTMNTSKWNKISQKDQEAILKINNKFFEEVACGLWDKQNKAAFSYAVEEKKLQVIELSAAEMEKWTNMVKPVQDDFVTRMKAQGFDGQKILDTVQSLSQKYNK